MLNHKKYLTRKQPTTTLFHQARTKKLICFIFIFTTTYYCFQSSQEKTLLFSIVQIKFIFWKRFDRYYQHTGLEHNITAYRKLFSDRSIATCTITCTTCCTYRVHSTLYLHSTLYQPSKCTAGLVQYCLNTSLFQILTLDYQDYYIIKCEKYSKAY